MAADVVAVLDALGIRIAVAVGSSLGGGVAVLVDRLPPGRIERLLLCEAIAFPPGARPPGPPGRNLMAVLARKRRSVWPSRQALIASYAERATVRRLRARRPPAYAECGTVVRVEEDTERAARLVGEHLVG